VLDINRIFRRYNGGVTPAQVTLTGATRERALVALDAARKAGFTGDELIVIVAIAGRESNWNPSAHGVSARTKDNSYGLWQLNMIGPRGPKWAKIFGIDSYSELLDPYVNARAAKKMCEAMISYGKTCFHGWGPYKGNPPLGKAAKYVQAITELAQDEGAVFTVLRVGSSGEAVTDLQRALKRHSRSWDPVIAVDGEFGPRTKNAVLRFQRRYGLECDGFVGPETQAALEGQVQRSGSEGCA